jgi:uncharacterized protein (TIGR03435 family)
MGQPNYPGPVGEADTGSGGGQPDQGVAGWTDTLYWSARPPSVEAEADIGPDLLTAVQDQLGLKLERKKGPVEIVVIDHAEKVPTEN